jgi:hypothetical protein
VATRGERLRLMGLICDHSIELTPNYLKTSQKVYSPNSFYYIYME